MTIYIQKCDDERIQNAIMNNYSLNNFDTSDVINMHYMFLDATSFNKPLDKFDTRNVRDMGCMFCCATSFNQSLYKFDTRKVTNMESMFFNAEKFNQPLDNFDTRSVENMSCMFVGATSMFIGYIMRFVATAIFVYKKYNTMYIRYYLFSNSKKLDLYIIHMHSIKNNKENQIKIQSAIDGFIVD